MRLQAIIGKRRQIVVVSNPKVFALHGSHFINTILPSAQRVTPIVMGDGERFKSQTTVNRLYDQFHTLDMTRDDYVIALGGGVVGDTAGFAAATYKRGVHFIQAPTTLLAMVDASIGGKVGINHRIGKNQTGSFYNPSAVLIYKDWLATLEQLDVVSGLAEIIKAGFIGSKNILREVAGMNPEYPEGDMALIQNLIRQAILFKAEVVRRDPYDRDDRVILNFGHTFAHAIEKADRRARPKHGLAVLAGMVGAIHLSHGVGYLRRASTNSLLSFIAPFARYAPHLRSDNDDYIDAMVADKKKRSRVFRFVLLRGAGRPVIFETDAGARVRRAISFMKEFSAGRNEI